jgi:hypothetical protein
MTTITSPANRRANPGGDPAITDIVQRRGRLPRQGNSSCRFVADQPIDARA